MFYWTQGKDSRDFFAILYTNIRTERVQKVFILLP